MENVKYVIIDTGFFVAIGNRNDQFHSDAKKALEKIQDRKWITTWPVLTETAYLINQYSQTQYHNLLTSLSEGMCEIFSLEARHISRMKELSIKYKDLPMDLADASLVLLSEEMQIPDIVSTDQRDFNLYRWKNTKPFRNLMPYSLTGC